MKVHACACEEELRIFARLLIRCGIHLCKLIARTAAISALDKATIERVYARASNRAATAALVTSSHIDVRWTRVIIVGSMTAIVASFVGLASVALLFESFKAHQTTRF